MFPTARPQRFMYQDEARFRRISDTRYCWAKKPLRPEVKAMLIYQYTYAYAAVPPSGRTYGFAGVARREQQMHADFPQ
ncbi:hypothetical protein RIE95_07050 [Acidithiobacillus thiooxidans]|uniref:hypothetical protein n=1 Tax=Acidithiobacillus thiooxidans TaxID=930 RepID=UPI0028670235|nr:hypothetical protein [Acidithiobacillus thiooxidans]MDR7926745.1 hypothetical protein [Acidithiobacillus thiooxidans]